MDQATLNTYAARKIEIGQAKNIKEVIKYFLEGKFPQEMLNEIDLRRSRAVKLTICCY